MHSFCWQASSLENGSIYCCAPAHELNPKPRLVIVGDGPERQALKSLAAEIYPQAEFVGAKHGVELKPYFTEANLFVLPGTGGLAVQEAMSYGLPVIVAQGDGTQDDLVRPENGWQIPPGNFDALLNTMRDALSDAARLKRMGRRSVPDREGGDQYRNDGRDLRNGVKRFDRQMNGRLRPCHCRWECCVESRQYSTHSRYWGSGRPI